MGYTSLQNGSITTAMLQNLAVDSTKIAAGVVTLDQLDTRDNPTTNVAVQHWADLGSLPVRDGQTGTQAVVVGRVYLTPIVIPKQIYKAGFIFVNTALNAVAGS